MMAKVTQAHIDARRADILEAAARLFAEKGWQNTSMQEVAAEAGISTGAIYRYFPSKDDLLRATFEDATQGMRDRFAEEAALANSPLDTLLRVGRRTLEFPDCAHPSMYIETSLAAKQDPVQWGTRMRAMTLDTLRQIEDLVAAGQQAGEVNSDLDPAPTARVLYSLVPGIAALWTELGESPGIEGIIKTLETLLRNGTGGGDRPDA